MERTSVGPNFPDATSKGFFMLPILLTLASIASPAGLAQTSPRALIFCTSSDDNLLMNGTRQIEDFGDPTNCQRALAEARHYGLFCTSSDDNLLKDLNGTVVHDYDNPTDCQKGLTNPPIGLNPPAGTIYCTSSDDNLLKNGSNTIEDFGNPTDCARARDEAKRFGAFCTSSDDNLLKDVRGTVIHDFDNPTDCQNALHGGNSGGGAPHPHPLPPPGSGRGVPPPAFIFCTSSDDNLLMNGNTQIADFNNPTDCQRALGEARRYGAFCTSSDDNLLKDVSGTTLADFTNPTDCQNALGTSAPASHSPAGLIYCTSSDDNLLKYGSLTLADFGDPTNCARARDELKKYGAFCTSSDDNLLKDLSGSTLHDFDSPEACRKALTGL